MKCSMKKILPKSFWIKAALSACGLMSLSHGVFASGTSGSTRITGTINPDTTCTTEIDKPEVNYGDINASTLNQDKPTALASQPITWRITCKPLAAKFFFRVFDRSTVAPIDENLSPAIPGDETGKFYNAVADGRSIGGVVFNVKALSADGESRALLYDYYASTTYRPWKKYPGNRLPNGSALRYAVGAPADGTPTAAKDFVIEMEAIPVIGATAIKGLSSDLRFDAQLTIEVTQL